MKITTLFAVLIGGAFALSAAEQKPDCSALSLSMQKAVKEKAIEEVLKLLEKEISAAPACSCELIRSAIVGYKPTPPVVATMVDTAITAAPDHIEVIIMCALAAAPDAQAEILAVANKFGLAPNPLDMPGFIGEGANGQLLFSPTSPVFVNPPEVTTVNPKS